MTMDYSPWSERENWPFLEVAISPKPKRSRPSKLVHMHTSSTSTCMIFLSRFRSVKFFDDHGLIVHVRKGKLAVFGGSNISKTGGVTPTKIGAYAYLINPYMHDFFEPIPID